MILNAADATSGKGRITVSSGMNGENGYVRIEDEGCGMVEELLPHRFLSLSDRQRKRVLESAFTNVNR